MITVEVYSSGTEDLVATLSSSGKGKKCTVDAFDSSITSELEQFVDTVLSLPNRGRAYPQDRQVWMEALPVAKVSVPYWFKIVEEDVLISTNIEEVENDIEEDDDGEEYTTDGDGSEDEGGDGDSSDEGNTDGGNSHGEATDGGYLNPNG